MNALDKIVNKNSKTFSKISQKIDNDDLEKGLKKDLKGEENLLNNRDNETSIAEGKRRELKTKDKEVVDFKSRKNPTSVTIANVHEGIKKEKKYKNLRVLLDSGASESLIDEGYCDYKYKSNRTFSTAAGAFETSFESEIFFTLPEFSESKIVKWKFAVANS